jgi:hypothetical protein
MENYIIKVVIESESGKVMNEGVFNSQTITEVKAFGGNSLIDDFVKETLNSIRDDRRENPHHHQNRLD